MSRRRGLLLLLPPAWDAFQPYPSLPVLTGYLRARGIPVTQADLNLGFYLWLLRRERLVRAYEKGRDRIAGMEPDGQAATDAALRVVGGPYLADRCSEALRVLRSRREFYDLGRYRWALATLEQACRLWSARWGGMHLSLGGLWLEGGTWLNRLREIATDPGANPFYEYLEAELPSLVDRTQPAVVGVSVVQEDQLLAALTIGGLVKRMSPGTQVVLGGPLVASLASWWGGSSPLAPFVDMIVVGPGEQALEGLMAGKAASAVPNIVVGDHWPRRVWQGSVRLRPAPDYDGLRLDEYLSPEVVYSVVATRGCYWNRCAFCNLAAHGPLYEYRGSSRLAADMERLGERYGARFFDLAGEVVPLGSLVGLSREVQRRKLTARWHSQSRFDGRLGRQGARQLHAGGCRRVKFGLESGCVRVLKLMDKGISPDRAGRVMRACASEHVALTVFILVGFPGERPAEAWETAEFLLSDDAVLQSTGLYLSFSSFALERNARVASSPERYGVEVVGYRGDASVSMEHRAREGMSGGEVDAVRRAMGKAFAERSGDRAYPFPSTHSLLYVDAGAGAGPEREAVPQGRRVPVSALLDGRPALRADMPVLHMGSWAAAYDGATATPRRLGEQVWRVARLCDGTRTGREICETLASDGFPRSDAVMALAHLVSGGIVEA
jgi:anaerobic magnesium-protoporphyrin IX monomethyl ester cyclase